MFKDAEQLLRAFFSAAENSCRFEKKISVSEQTEIKKLTALLQTPKTGVVTTHYRPDGDAIGSSLAWCRLLNKAGHHFTVVTPNEFPSFLAWMPGANEILIADKNKSAAEKLISEAHVIFCLDFNALSRVENISAAVQSSQATKVLMDHHLDPEKVFDISFSNSLASATCEMVYEIAEQVGLLKYVDAEIASCIYTGIMTDTKSFRFQSMKPNSHRIIAALLEAGAKNDEIHERVFDENSLMRMKMLGYCLYEKLTVLEKYNTAFISLSSAEQDRFHFQTGDSEGIVNYGLGIAGVRMAALFTEGEGLIKISFRSKGNFSVKDLAAKYFSGGGHKNASGGKSHESLEATIQKFISVLPEYESQLKSKA